MQSSVSILIFFLSPFSYVSLYCFCSSCFWFPYPFSWLSPLFISLPCLYFCFLCRLGCEFLFFLSFPPGVTLRCLSTLVFRFFVVKNKPEMDDSLVMRVIPTLLGGSWQVSDAFGYIFILPAPRHCHSCCGPEMWHLSCLRL